MRLGQALLLRGLVTLEQLEAATIRQVTAGGRLGTNLVELGFVNDQDLRETLAAMHSVRPVDPADLRAIPAELTGLLTSALAERYRAIPFRRDRHGVHVALTDPANLRILDDLRARFGREVRPYVISECRMLYYLRKHYGVEPYHRYAYLMSGFAAEEAEVPRHEVGRPPTLREEDLADARRVLAQRLAGAASREDLGRALLRYAGSILDRAALFVVQGGQAVGWLALGDRDVRERIGQLILPLTGKGLLAEVARSQAVYVGHLPEGPENGPLRKGLGTPGARAACVLPITYENRTVLLLYGEGSRPAALAALQADLTRTALQASLALQILVLRNRLLDM
ncbi:MAG: hypothetical protein HY576_03015 [candidate division NC10 bacterium]|nr:hypothetical protein [candidate division NC10 bacterium]